MNEVLKTIQGRRSIRNYRAEQIGADELQQILKAAIWAPNGVNQQKWHFTVIQNQETLDRMVDVIKENAMNSGNPFIIEKVKTPGYHTFYHAPTVVMVSAEKGARFKEIDCGAAAENMALAAASLGVGSCLMASPGLLFASDRGNEMAKELGIPDGYAHEICVSLGYADGEVPEPPARREDVFNYVK